MKKIVIIGSGGFAKEVAFLIEDINKQKKEWDFLGYIDKNEEIGTSRGKYKVFQHDEWLENIREEIYVVISIGDPSLIKKISEALQKNKNIKFPNLIHPNVIGDWDRINMGEGNIICTGTIFTTEITIGSFNIINLDCTVGHDTIIGDYNVFNPSVNISGDIIFGSESLVGTGAQIIDDKKIVSNVIIGAGSVVVKNIEESGVYVGIPAKKIK